MTTQTALAYQKSDIVRNVVRESLDVRVDTRWSFAECRPSVENNLLFQTSWRLRNPREVCHEPHRWRPRKGQTVSQKLHSMQQRRRFLSMSPYCYSVYLHFGSQVSFLSVLLSRWAIYKWLSTTTCLSFSMLLLPTGLGRPSPGRARVPRTPSNSPRRWPARALLIWLISTLVAFTLLRMSILARSSKLLSLWLWSRLSSSWCHSWWW